MMSDYNPTAYLVRVLNKTSGYGDYLTLKHVLLQAQQDAAIQVGEYWISRRGEDYWIEHESGEGMQVFRVNFEKLISDFYKQEF